MLGQWLINREDSIIISSNADEMFRKLGYKKKEDKEEIIYTLNNSMVRIIFDKAERNIRFDNSNYISIKVEKAINKKIGELKWIQMIYIELMGI